MKHLTILFSFLIMLTGYLPCSQCSAKQTEDHRIYFAPSDVQCNERGIFVRFNDTILSARAIAHNKKGLYCLKSWLATYPLSKGKEGPRGAHSNNKREGNRERHETANARRQREQEAARRRQEEARRRGRRGRKDFAVFIERPNKS